jgi:hypothetical protein
MSKKPIKKPIKNKPIKQQQETWWCCGVERPIDQRCSCGDSSKD